MVETSVNSGTVLFTVGSKNRCHGVLRTVDTVLQIYIPSFFFIYIHNIYNSSILWILNTVFEIQLQQPEMGQNRLFT
jgi:hypothetical protein